MSYLKHIILVLLATAIGLSTVAQKTAAYTEATKLFEHAKMLYVKKQYVPAIGEFRAFIKTDPGSNLEYESNAYIGLSRLKLNKQNAARDLVKFYKSQPEHKINISIIYELGIYYFNNAKYARCLKYLEQIEEKYIVKSKREELAFKKGYSYFKDQQYTKAKNEFKKVMYGDGEYAIEANYYYGFQCKILTDYACAMAIFEKIGDKGPKTMNLYIAQMYYEQEEYEKAYEIVKDVTISKKQDDIQLQQVSF